MDGVDEMDEVDNRPPVYRGIPPVHFIHPVHIVQAATPRSSASHYYLTRLCLRPTSRD